MKPHTIYLNAVLLPIQGFGSKASVQVRIHLLRIEKLGGYEFIPGAEFTGLSGRSLLALENIIYPHV